MPHFPLPLSHYVTQEVHLITQTMVLSGEYYDSVTLLQVAQGLLALPGIADAAVVMGTPANKGLLVEAGLLTPEVEAASPDDLIIAVRAADAPAALKALGEAQTLLKTSRRTATGGSGLETPPKTLGAAIERLGGEANIALVSVAGRYAAGVAREALHRGLHVFLFSDNVAVEDEIALKTLAREKGLLVMGPDAGTAILNHVALGFANVVPPGPVGVVAASGTGLQAVTCYMAREGVGITQAIGVGGRDLKAEVGGIMMLEGLKALQADPATKVLLLVSKPPSPEVAEKVLTQVRQGDKPAVVLFLGGDPAEITRAGAIPVADMEEAAAVAAAVALGQNPADARINLRQRDLSLKTRAAEVRRQLAPGQRYFRGLFSGGTFCYETQLILKGMGIEVQSNAPVEKRLRMADANKSVGHVAVDLGEDEFTVGRLHPMIDPGLRNRRILHEAQDPETAVIFLDVVIGYGSHADPAGEAVKAIKEAQTIARDAGRELLFIASVCGTADDPQDLGLQEARLEAAGVMVLPTNAAATRLAGHVLDF